MEGKMRTCHSATCPLCTSVFRETKPCCKCIFLANRSQEAYNSRCHGIWFPYFSVVGKPVCFNVSKWAVYG